MRERSLGKTCTRNRLNAGTHQRQDELADMAVKLPPTDGELLFFRKSGVDDRDRISLLKEGFDLPPAGDYFDLPCAFAHPKTTPQPNRVDMGRDAPYLRLLWDLDGNS